MTPKPSPSTAPHQPQPRRHPVPTCPVTASLWPLSFGGPGPRVLLASTLCRQGRVDAVHFPPASHPPAGAKLVSVPPTLSKFQGNLKERPQTIRSHPFS